MERIVRLKHKTAFDITPTKPFNFDGTFNKPSHYSDNISSWKSGRYWQSFRLGENLFGIRIDDKGTMSSPKIRVAVFHSGSLAPEQVERIKKEIEWRFDLEADLSEFDALIRSDRRFAPVFRRWRGMRVSSSDSLYELMMIAIFLQNATIRRTVQMTSVMLQHYGTKLVFDGKTLYAMWLPKDLENVSVDELRALKIGYRAKFIKRLSEDFAHGVVDEFGLRRMDVQSAKGELMKLYGVGPETARILLFEVLHDYGTFEHIAPWQQKIYSMLFYNRPLVPASRISKDIKRAYGRYAMLAVHYISEDIFWKRKTQHIPWLEKEIRL